MRLFRTLPLFLFLLPLFLVIHEFTSYEGLLEWKYVSLEVLKIFAVQIIIVLAILIFQRNFRKVALLAFAVALVYFFFSDMKDWLHDRYPNSLISSYKFLLPAILLALFLFFLQVKKTQSPFSRAFVFLNTALLFFCLADVFKAAIGRPVPLIKYEQSLPVKNTTAGNSTAPDVYLLLFDAYASNYALQTEFGFRNHALDTVLNKQGFFLSPASQSNYSLTPFSMLSCLNMNYLSFSSRIRHVRLPEYLSAAKAIDQSIIPKYFTDKGYDCFNQSIFKLNGIDPETELYDLWDMRSVFRRHHIFLKIYDDIGWQFASKMPLQRGQEEVDRDGNVDANITQLKSVATRKISRPKFVYTHLLIPHEPYTRGPGGVRLPLANRPTNRERMPAYIEQVKYSNELIESAVKIIKENSTRPLVILLMGDHGYRYNDSSQVMKEFANLNAIYFSDGNYSGVEKNRSPVNTFRFLLNKYFDEQLPLLPDSTVYLNYW